MRVLVLGGTGFIGRAAVVELVGAGHEVCIVHRGAHEPDDLPEVRHVHADRMELGGVRDELVDFDPEAVLDNTALHREHVNVVFDVLPAGLRYVATSSADVYRAYSALMAGRASEPVPIDETSPVREERYPYRERGGAFARYEKLDVEDRYRERDATILRLPMVYGEHDYQRREEPILRRVRAGRKQIPVGSGGWLGAKAYVRDVARGMRLALQNDGAAGEVINLAESRTYPMGAWVELIVQAAGVDTELVRVPDDALPPDLAITGAPGQHLLIDASKARWLLGFADTDPHEAIRRSVAWHLDNPPSDGSDDFTADEEALGS